MWCDNYRWNFDYARLAYDAGFSFENQKHQTNLDLSKIALIDIETLIREKDVSTIERFIPLVSQFALEGEQVKILDPCFVKVFRISQLTVEYLIFCKKYLDNTVVLLKKELSSSIEENTQLKTTIQELKSDTNHLRRKLKEIENATLPEIATFRCDHCAKVFATEDYLEAHIRRRHELPNNSAYQEETNKLQLEIKELKERLNTTEKLITNHDQPSEKDVDTTKDNNNWCKLEELQQKFEVLKTHVESELKLMHTQKEFQEKYEKLFEVSINKTKAVFLEAENLREKLENNDLQSRKNSATQTYLQMQEVAIEASCEDFEQLKPIQKTPDLKLNLEKMQQELVAETQQQIHKVEGALEEMVATSLGKIENQVQTALEKFSEQAIKEIKDSPQKSLTPVKVKHSSQESLEIKRPVAPPRYFLSANATPQEQKRAVQKSVPKSKSIEPSIDYASCSKSQETIVKQKSKESIQLYANSIKSKETIAERKSKETIQLYTNKDALGMDSDSESQSEELQKEENIVNTKPSTSTLGQYSTTRIENAASSEEVFNQLREEVEQLVERRLKEIGVSPDWKGLPQRSFAQALAVVNHQAELSKKKFPDFLKIQKKLVKELLRIIRTNKRNGSASSRKENTKKFAVVTRNTNYSDTESEDDRKKLPLSSPISKTAYDSVISEFIKRRKPKTHIESSSSDAPLQIQEKGDVAIMKSALRNELQVVEKKKVAFVDGDGDQNLKGGSTTSIASSVFDAPKLNMISSLEKEKKKVDSDISEWDISEILE